MTKTPKLFPSMSEEQFDTGYWYATEIKAFAEEIGIPTVGKLRKDELEAAIKAYIRTGTIQVPTKRSLSKSGVTDVERGLSLKLPVVNYRSNKDTKDFIVKEAQKIVPGLKEKSGVRYRLNRWREEQLSKGNTHTYEDLVKHYLKLNQVEGRFPQAPSGRYINFLSDFLANENHATRAQALAAWKKLKELPIPKNYQAWVQHARQGCVA